MTALSTLNNGWPSIAIGEKTQTTIKRRNEDSLSRLEVLDLGRTLGQNRRIDSEIAAGQSVARPEATRSRERKSPIYPYVLRDVLKNDRAC